MSNIIPFAKEPILEMLEVYIHDKATNREWIETHMFPVSAWDVPWGEIAEEISLLKSQVIYSVRKTGCYI
jgi:hypothetical protein